MQIFICYSRTDLISVQSLYEDIEQARHLVWFDRKLDGGQAWWDEIVQQLKACDLFVFVLSPDSVRSRVCKLELSHTLELDRPILPIKVRDIDEQLAPAPIPEVQTVDYRSRTPESGIRLMVAISAVKPRPLPDPLPSPPPPPVRLLGSTADRVSASSLNHDEQLQLLHQLGDYVSAGDDQGSALELLRQLRDRPDIVESVGRSIDSLLSRLPIALASPGRDGARRAQSTDLLQSLVTQIRRNRFTPILGSGLTDLFLGSRRLIAQEWLKSFEFPLATSRREDLAEIAQFVAVMTDRETLEERLGGFYRRELLARYHNSIPHKDASISDTMRVAWRAYQQHRTAEPHSVLAKLPCPLYVTTHPSNLMADALTLAGKAPEVEFCRWAADSYEWPPSIFDRQPEYVPTADRPLVFHVFGHLDVPGSLVLTEDDYFDFLTTVAGDPTVIPLVVSRALADSALLLLGFRLDDWDVRVVLWTLVNQQGARRLRKYTHVAAQIEESDEMTSPGRARRYLERYFGKSRQPSIDIFWGSVEEFSDQLTRVWDMTT